MLLIYGVAFVLVVYFAFCLYYSSPMELNNPLSSSGKPYAPNKFGSPGASPSGGMRHSSSIPSTSPVGYWGNSPHVKGDVHLDIYDYSDLPVEYITDIGHW